MDMVIVTEVEKLAFMSVILQQILEFGEGRIIFMLAMAAIPHVQILPALRA